MERIRIKAGHFEFVAKFESERAPKTCAKFRSMLPYKERIIHVRWSGEGCWIPLGDLLLVLAVSLVTSKGAHGVPGSAIVILLATLNAVPTIPVIGLVLVLSVDWFIGMARALGNLIGNCVATVVVAAWEGDLDREKARHVLDGDVVVDVTAG